jgi:integrase
MNTVKRQHIEELFFNEEKFKNNSELEIWLNSIQISSKSKFHDEIWYLDGLDCYQKYFQKIDFTKKTNAGNQLSDYPHLLDTIKKVLFFYRTTLLTRYKRKGLTQIQDFNYLKSLVDWMVENKIKSFKEFSKENFNDYQTWVIQNKCTKNMNNLSYYLAIFNSLYLYKSYLNDSIQEDFFEGMSIKEFTGYKKTLSEKVEAIPKNILEKFCYSILPMIDQFNNNVHSLEDLYESNIINTEHLYNANSNSRNIYKVKMLNAMCYSVIALYTGMRVSEIVSIKKNSYEVDENNTVVLNSTLFKLTVSDNGRPEKWGCGLNNENNYALKAIKILERVTPEEYKNLFFQINKDKIEKPHTEYIKSILSELMNFLKIDWKLTSHQFRKTFAQLIAITDKTSLLALKEHFKHVSLAMTDYYVGTNIDLIESINHEKQIEIREGFDLILKSHNLAGKLGEKISQTNIKFRGDIEKRKEYINDILDNSDLIVVPHEYGFCVYQPEQAKCKGEEVNIGLNTCSKCNNFIVTSKHKVFWLNKVQEYQNFANNIQELENQKDTLITVNKLIDEATQIIQKIEKE